MFLLQVTFHFKNGLPNLKRYLLNKEKTLFCAFKSESDQKDIIVFLSWKVFNSENLMYYIVSEADMRKSLYQETINENK